MTTVNRTSIEFVVRPKEDLHLEGSLRRLPRVSKGEAYPCQMQKNQNFSCLFRHYAKHNGLRKEDLIFSFVEELLPDQTPETVHLMPQDEIFVEHRKANDAEYEELPKQQTYSNHFKLLLLKGVHSDITFVLNNDSTINAHKAILSARSEYFEAMFRIGGMSESSSQEIYINHDTKSFKRMLEFIYTNNVEDLSNCSSQEAISLLMMSNEYLLDDLRLLCENRVITCLTIDNIGKLLLLSSGHNASSLKDACFTFVQENKEVLVNDLNFRAEIENNSELGLLLFESSVPKLANPSSTLLSSSGHAINTIGDDSQCSIHHSSSSLIGKKRRRSNSHGGNGSSRDSSNNDSSNEANDFEFITAPLNTSSSSNSGINNTNNSNGTIGGIITAATNTISQPNANINDL